MRHLAGRDRPSGVLRFPRLYGEQAPPAQPAFLHVESIDTRSRRHGWIIQPHRHGELHQIFLVLEGGGTARLDHATWQCRAPAVMTIPAELVHGFSWEAGTNGYVLTVASSVLSEVARRHPALGWLAEEPLARAWKDGGPPTGLADSLQALMAEIGWSESAGSAVAEAHLLLCLAILTQCRPGASGTTSPATRDRVLYERFRREIDALLTAGASVPDLARRAGVSRRRLGDACRAVAGRSPLEVLHGRLLIEAERKLLYSLKPVAEIAFELGFDDPAYFSRFFSARVGCSPRAFRKSRGGSHGGEPAGRRGAEAVSMPPDGSGLQPRRHA